MWEIDEFNNKIHKTAIISDNVVLGKNNIIYPYAVIGLIGFIRGFEDSSGKVIIGDDNKFGNHCSVMVGTEGNTVIGDGNLIMNYANIGHDVIVGNNNEIGPRSILAGWSVLGNNNKLKLSINVRNRVVIGSGNIIGMSSNVIKDVGDDKLLYGNPCKVIKSLVNGKY